MSSKEARFIKAGNVILTSTTRQPQVVVSVTSYWWGGMDYIYLETQQLFNQKDTARHAHPADAQMDVLDPDEAARLYSLHKNGNPQPDPSKVDLSDYEKMTKIVQNLLEGDIVADNQNIVHAEVLKVENTTFRGVILVTYKRYSDDKIIYDRLPMSARVTIYRKRAES